MQVSLYEEMLLRQKKQEEENCLEIEATRQVSQIKAEKEVSYFIIV